MEAARISERRTRTRVYGGAGAGRAMLRATRLGIRLEHITENPIILKKLDLYFRSQAIHGSV
jgi:hypothetical protein